MERIKKVQNLKQQGKGGSHAYKMATIVALACTSKASSFLEDCWVFFSRCWQSPILGPPKILA
jgi:hypothetical protein